MGRGFIHKRSTQQRADSRRSAQNRSLTKHHPKDYLHGFTATEQKRLYHQARFLEKSVYRSIDFSEQSQILEVGCGVGAQTAILLERFPHLRITGVDWSQAQLDQAKKHLSKPIKKSRVKLIQADATKLPFESYRFDGAFICWFLEHVQKPVAVLREVRRTLQKGAPIYCSEVLNSSLFVNPYSPAILKYWFEYNDYQYSIKGDPFAGAKLGNHLKSAGFREIQTRAIHFLADNRDPKHRAAFIKEWLHLSLSAAPALLAHKRVTPKLVQEMIREFKALNKAKNSVFYYSFIQALAYA